ncbi:hypothetical protein [Brasilonema sp. UFV-L1]|uniref:hypothetical protein n=1 Tax=Brasilonema sp. UFV-L1 TaxID=2234130 RepID=UPI00145C5157|nr:hypothetical protein [Brasilonema sp. UFV-L1]NMG09114.1 hypothetical protein [Brasilonema sp. UFV-L1]
MVNQIVDVVDTLSYPELAGLLTACGYAIREQTILSRALLELSFEISKLLNENGFLNSEYQDVVNDIDLALLAGLCAVKLTQMATTLEEINRKYHDILVE